MHLSAHAAAIPEGGGFFIDTVYSTTPSGSVQICNGNSVTFSLNSNMTSIPGFFTYQWKLDNVNIPGATQKNYTANVTGNYTLVIGRPNGDTTVNAAALVVNPNPVADFTFSPTTNCAGVPIGFFPQANSPTSIYQWEFGDGSSETASIPLHAFFRNYGNGTDDFSVKLTVTDNKGCTNQKTNVVTIKQKPEAKLSGTTTVCTGSSQSTFTFNNASGTQSINTNYQIIWGDGTADLILSVFNTAQTHIYNRGSSTLLEIVTGDNGCKDTLTRIIYLGSNPSAGIASPGNTNICENSPLTFPISNIATNSPGTNYTILFNDGTPNITFDQANTLTSVTHIYTKNSCGTTSNSISNSFIAKIEATNPCATTQGSVTPIYVSGYPKPGISASTNNTCINVPVSVTNISPNFKTVSTNGQCTNGFKVWEISPNSGYTLAVGQSLGNRFNDSNPENWDPSPSNTLNITFSTAGTYTVRLYLGGSSTCGSAFTETTICVNPVPTSSFTLDNNIGCMPVTVATTNNSSAATCGINTPQWSVSYANPTACSPNASSFSVTSGTLTSNNPGFSFNNPGTYTVQLITIAPNNACASLPITRTVTVKSPPNVSIQVPATVCSGQFISVTQIVNNCYATNPTPTYAWTITGATPGSSAAANPGPILITTAGTQIVTLSVTNECGTSSDTKNILVYETPAITGTLTSPSSCAGSNGNIQLSGLTPSGIYSVKYTKAAIITTLTKTADVSGVILLSGLTAGTYTNVFVIQNGCSSNALGPFVLTDPNAPNQPTVVNSGPVCSGTTVQFSATATTPGVTYSWSGPNGYTSALQNPVINNIAANAGGIYTVTVSLSGCSSSATTTVVVNATPALPTVAPVAYCQNTTATPLTAGATSGNTLRWFTVASGGSPLALAPTPSTASTGTTQYYVSQITASGCESGRATLTVTVSSTPIITNVIANNTLTCGGNEGSLVITGLSAGVTYTVKYTRGGSANTVSKTADGSGIITVGGLNLGAYSNIFVQLGGCSSNVITGPFIILDPSPPNVPTVGNSGPVCSGSTLALSAVSTTPGVTYAWVGPNGFTSTLQNPAISNVALTAAGTYTVTVKINNCQVPGTTVVVVRATPAAPGVSPLGVCENSTPVSLSTTTQSVNTPNWYLTPTGGVASGIAPIPPTTPVGVTTYYVSETTPAGCEGARAALVVTVSSTPNITGANTFNPTTCLGTEGKIELTGLAINTAYQAYYSKNSSPVGPVNITSNATGVLTITDLTAGSYQNIRVQLGSCVSNLVGPFTLTDPSNPSAATFQPITSVCSGNTLVLNATSTTPGVTYAWAGPNNFSSNLQNPAIANATILATGNYTVTVSKNNCTATSAISATVNPTPPGPSVIDVHYCKDAIAVALTATAQSGSTVVWYANASGGAPLASAPIPSTAVLGNTTYYVSQLTTEGCEGPRSAITVSVTGIPVANTVTDKMYCTGINTGNIVFSSSIVGTVYNWTNTNPAIGLDASGIGTISFTTTNTNPAAISATIQVTPSVGGCDGAPVSFTITILPKPALSSGLIPTPVCTGTLFQYTATSATANVSYSWSRPAVAGISKPATSSSNSSGIISETLYNVSQAPIIVRYQVTMQSNGCAAIQAVDLTVNPDAKAQFTSTTLALCAPGVIDNNNINATAYPFANVSYRWLANNNSIGTSFTFPGYTITLPNDTVQIKLAAISLYGCKTDTAQQTFKTIARPTPAFVASTKIGCGPLVVSFSNTTTPQPYQQFNYTWRFGNGTTSTLKDPLAVTFQPSKSHLDTTYYITLTAALQCDTITTLRDSVIVRSTPIALFQPDTTIGCSLNTSPYTFTAFNISIGKPNTYFWSYGDNTYDTTFTESPVSHVFKTFSITTYTISLRAQNECGSNKDSIKIIVYPRNIFAKLFVEGPNTWGCAPDTMTFRNVSSGATRYEINFGDGSADSIYVSDKSVETIKHFYKNAGVYTVSMKASNGCVNTDTTVYLQIQMFSKPGVGFSTSKNAYCLNERVQFTNQSDLGYSYQWDFGDGTGSVGFSPAHLYTLPGTYLVKLIIRSINAGATICSDSLTKQIIINPLPVLSLNSNLQIKNCAPYNFTGNANQPAGNIVNWFFSDPLSSDTTSLGNIGTHTFFDAGDFSIRVTALNSLGCSDTGYLTAKVIASPRAAFLASDSIKCFKQDTVVFTNQTTYAGADVVVYNWKVTDTLKKTTTHFTYDFRVPDTISAARIYQVKLTATSSFGCKDSVTKIISFLPPAIAKFNFTNSRGCAPLTITVNNTSLYADAFKWYLNDTLVSTVVTPLNMILSRPGTTYAIKLVANRATGCVADSVTQTMATYEKPVVNFSSLDIKPGCTGNLQLQLTDLSIGNADPVDSWFWDFGDGSESRNKNPAYSYTIPGKYIVKHAVTNNKGCISDTLSRTYTNFGKPTLRFTLNDVCLGTPIRPVIILNDPGFGSTRITKYLWDFGDGTTDTASLPVHNYTKEGQYKVTLTVVADSSCVSDSSSKTIRILGKPIANYSFTNNCVNVPVLFFDKSALGFGQTGNTLYMWDFGDGSARSNLQNPVHAYRNTGTYAVSLVVSSLLCQNVTDTFRRSVKIVTGRDGIVYPRITTARELPIQLKAQPGVAYKWLPSTGLNADTLQNPTALYRAGDPSSIFYTIQIKDTSGCTIIDGQEVWIFNEPDIQAPTAFTPNGDGANDRFQPAYIEITRLQYFRIFDRWGKLIFETSDMGQTWDGTYQGKPLPMDTFVFVASGIDKKGNTVIRKGNVTLIRD
jgi:gliding motility-associated-like protein